MFKYVIFDLDGTIVDSTDALTYAFKYAYDQLEINYPGDETIIDKFGKSLNVIIHELRIPIDQQNQFANYFSEAELNTEKFELVNGINQVLKSVKLHHPLTIVTSKQRKNTIHMLEVTGLDNQIENLVTADDVEQTKPHPEPLFTACNLLNTKPGDHIAYVGDSLHDLKAAKDAGIVPVAVTWGVHGEQVGNSNEISFDSPLNLKQFLSENLTFQ